MDGNTEKSTNEINAVPFKIKWIRRVGHVMFRDPKTGRVYTVQGMTIEGRKGAFAVYNRRFRRKIFVISLNAGGNGIHFCEGIRWEDTTQTWIQIPMPPPYLSVVSQGAFEKPCAILLKYVWGTPSCSSGWWGCDEKTIDIPLFRRSETDGPLNCWDHRLDSSPCTCEGVNDLRKQFEGYSIHVECKFCHKCSEFFSEESCPTCLDFFIKKSLLGVEKKCQLCSRGGGLNQCVAVRSNFLSGYCDHSFHRSCIIKWFRAGNKSCPICQCQHIFKKEKNSYNDVDGWSDPEDDPYDDCRCHICVFGSANIHP